MERRSCAKNQPHSFNRFDKTPTCDRQRQRQTVIHRAMCPVYVVWGVCPKIPCVPLSWGQMSCDWPSLGLRAAFELGLPPRAASTEDNRSFGRRRSACTYGQTERASDIARNPSTFSRRLIYVVVRESPSRTAALPALRIGRR